MACVHASKQNGRCGAGIVVLHQQELDCKEKTKQHGPSETQSRWPAALRVRSGDSTAALADDSADAPSAPAASRPRGQVGTRDP
eukprot:6185227-Pleurochrysis_carterae.AAC.1